MKKHKKDILKALILALFLITYYFMTLFISNLSSVKSYLPYYIWTYGWTLFIVAFCSMDRIKTLIHPGKIKINIIYLLLTLFMLTIYIPISPLFYFMLLGEITAPLLIFWYCFIHTFEK